VTSVNFNPPDSVDGRACTGRVYCLNSVYSPGPPVTAGETGYVIVSAFDESGNPFPVDPSEIFAASFSGSAPAYWNLGFIGNGQLNFTYQNPSPASFQVDFVCDEDGGIGSGDSSASESYSSVSIQIPVLPECNPSSAVQWSHTLQSMWMSGGFQTTWKATMMVVEDVMASMFFKSSLALYDLTNGISQDGYGNYGFDAADTSNGIVSSGVTYDFEYSVAGLSHTTFTLAPGACLGPMACATSNQNQLVHSSFGSNGTVLQFSLVITNTGAYAIENIELRLDFGFGVSASPTPNSNLLDVGGGWFFCPLAHSLLPNKSTSACGYQVASYYYVNPEEVQGPFSLPVVSPSCGAP